MAKRALQRAPLKFASSGVLHMQLHILPECVHSNKQTPPSHHPPSTTHCIWPPGSPAKLLVGWWETGFLQRLPTPTTTPRPVVLSSLPLNEVDVACLMNDSNARYVRKKTKDANKDCVGVWSF